MLKIKDETVFGMLTVNSKQSHSHFNNLIPILKKLK